MHDDIRMELSAGVGREGNLAAPDLGWVLRRARRLRLQRMAAGAVAASLVLALGAVAIGNLPLETDRPQPAPPAPRDVAELPTEDFITAVFRDSDLRAAVPDGFRATAIVRNGPERTNHSYWTVGVRMEGPVDYARSIFFVFRDDRGAKKMYAEGTWGLRHAWRRFADRAGAGPYAQPVRVPRAPTRTVCGAGTARLFQCHATHGRVHLWTQSSAGTEPTGGRVTKEQREAALTLARAFTTYLVRHVPNG